MVMSSGLPAATISPPPSPPLDQGPGHASGPRICDPVGPLDHLQIVLNSHDCFKRV